MKITLHENITAYLQEKNIIQNYPSSKYGVICENAEDIAAYLYYSKSHYHPSALYLRFAILDKSMEPEILTEMYDKFKTVLPASSIILQIHRSFEMYEKLINDNDFVEFRRTYESELELQELISRFSEDDQYDLQKFIMSDDLLDITRKVYQSNHTHNPLRNMGLSEWNDLITDDLDFNHSIVLYDQNDEIIAYMLIYENDETSKDLGYCYYQNQEAKQLLNSAFHTILLQLQEAGFTHLNLELDSTDKYSYELFGEFVQNEAPALISYIK